MDNSGGGKEAVIEQSELGGGGCVCSHFALSNFFAHLSFSITKKVTKLKSGVGEMAQQMRTFAAFAQDHHPLGSSQLPLIPLGVGGSRSLRPLLASIGAACTQRARTHTHTHLHAEI